MRRVEDTSRLKLTKDDAVKRAKQEARVFELGYPRCPQQYAYNNKPMWALWVKNATKLYHAHLLSYSDDLASVGILHSRIV